MEIRLHPLPCVQKCKTRCIEMWIKSSFWNLNSIGNSVTVTAHITTGPWAFNILPIQLLVQPLIKARIQLELSFPTFHWNCYFQVIYFKNQDWSFLRICPQHDSASDNENLTLNRPSDYSNFLFLSDHSLLQSFNPLIDTCLSLQSSLVFFAFDVLSDTPIHFLSVFFCFSTLILFLSPTHLLCFFTFS